MLKSMSMLLLLLSVASAAPRKEAPDFALPLITNEKDTLKLSDLKGKVVILDFWATWCRPCRMEIPSFIDLYKTYKDSGFVMVGIAIDKVEKVKKFYKRFKLNYPVVMSNKKLELAYGGISGIPTTFVLDKSGRIYKKYVGYRPKSTFEEDIKKLLKEPFEEKDAEKEGE
jgi:peroxiredoxin